MPTAYSFLRFCNPPTGARRTARAHAGEAIAYCAERHIALDDALHVRPASTAQAGGRSGTEAALDDFLERVRDGHVAKGSLLLIEGLGAVTRAEAAGIARALGMIVESGITVAGLAAGAEVTRAAFKRDPSALLYFVAGFVHARETAERASRRARASWARRRERAHRNQRISAVCPAWLSLDRGSGMFRVDKGRARVVERIYREALRGAGQAQIAAGLDRDGVAVFGRGQRWHRSYVLKLLRNAAVVGTYTPHTLHYVEGHRVRKPAGKAIRNYYPRIIDPDVYLQVQTLVNDSRTPLRGRHARAGEITNVFGGLAHCGRCGAPVTAVTKGKMPSATRYLVCSAARVRAGCRRYEAIPYDRFERSLLDNRERLLSRAHAGERRADLDGLLAEAEAAAARINGQMEELLECNDRGGRSSALRKRVLQLGTERDKLLIVADSLRAERETTTRAYVRDRVHELQAALAGDPLDRTLVNTLMRQVFSSVTVDYDGGDLAFLWRHGGQTEIDLGS